MGGHHAGRRVVCRRAKFLPVRDEGEGADRLRATSSRRTRAARLRRSSFRSSAARARWSRTTRTSIPRGPTSNSPARKRSIFRPRKGGTPTSIADFKGNMDIAALEAFIRSRGCGTYPALHDHRDEQLRRRPTGLDGRTSARRKRLCREARDPALPRRLPVRGERLLHQAARAGIQRRPREGDRPGRCSPTPTARR